MKVTIKHFRILYQEGMCSTNVPTNIIIELEKGPPPPPSLYSFIFSIFFSFSFSHSTSFTICVSVSAFFPAKASASRAEDPGFDSRMQRDFSGSSNTSDLKIYTSVTTLPGVWCYRVSTGTGRPGVSVMWLGKVESLICNFYLSVAARKIVWADPSLTYTSMLLGC